MLVKNINLVHYNNLETPAVNTSTGTRYIMQCLCNYVNLTSSRLHLYIHTERRKKIHLHGKPLRNKKNVLSQKIKCLEQSSMYQH